MKTVKGPCNQDRYHPEMKHGAKGIKQFVYLPFRPRIEVIFSNEELAKLFRYFGEALDVTVKTRATRDPVTGNFHDVPNGHYAGSFAQFWEAKPRNGAFMISTDGADIGIKVHGNISGQRHSSPSTSTRQKVATVASSPSTSSSSLDPTPPPTSTPSSTLSMKSSLKLQSASGSPTSRSKTTSFGRLAFSVYSQTRWALPRRTYSPPFKVSEAAPSARWQELAE
jgi:hypothetical protein